jgi:hypothetical protein
MPTTSYEDVLASVQQLTLDEQRRLRAEMDELLPDIATSTKEEPLPPSIRLGLAADLKALDELAAQIGAAWQSNRTAAEAVNDQRR